MPTYIANGKKYNLSEEEVQDFLKDFPNAQKVDEPTVEEPKKIEPAVEEAAPAAGQDVTDLQQEDGSSEFQDPKDFDTSWMPKEAPKATEEQIKAYEESVKLDKEAAFEGELRRIQEQRKAPEEMTATEKMAQSMENMYLRIQNIAPKINLSSGVIYRKIFGDENVDKFVNAVGKDSFWAEGLTKEEMVEASRIIELNQQKMGPTGEIIKGFKNADAAEVLAGAVNAGTSLIPSMLEIMAGGGTSAVLLADFFADSYKTINTEKAESKGKTLEKLIDDNEDETLAPALYAAAMAKLEKIGFDVITKAATKQLKGTAIKKLANFVGAGSAEMTTEVLQTSLEKSQEEYGKTGSVNNAAKAFVEALDDQETWEAGIQGFVGGAGFSGAGNKDVRKAISALRAPVELSDIESDIEKLSKLNNDLAKAKDPEIVEGIKKNIKEVKQNLSNRIIKGNSIIELFSKKDIEKINNTADLAKMQISRVRNLENKLNKGEVTIEEYNSAIEGYKASFIEAKNRIKGISENAIVEAQAVEGVSEISIKNANEINKAYEANPGSTEVFNNIVVPKMQPLLNKVANKLFKEYSEFGEKAESKADFITDLTYGTDKNPASSLRGLYKSFNPEEGQLLSTYIVRNLENRGKRILDEKVGQQVTEGATSIEAPQAQQLTAEERIDAAVAEDKIDIGKSIGLKFDDNKVKNIVVKHSNPDAKKFKTQIANDFKLAFKDPVNKFLGKDTKTKKQFTETVTNNAPALYDMLTVEGMRMARGVDGINPFVENGMLIEQDGKLEKAAFDNEKVNSLINYLTSPDLTKQARSNRQVRFKEALAVSIASSQAVNLLSKDTELRNRYQDLNQVKQNIVAEISGAANQDIATLNEISQARSINEAAKIAGIKNKITIDDNNREEKKAQMLSAIEKARIPSWVFEGSKFANFARRKVDGVYIDLPARGGLYYGSKDPAYQEALALAKTFDGEYNIAKPKRVNVLKAFTPEGQKQGQDNLKALEFTANKLAEAVANNQMPIEIAALFISSGYQATTGIIKIAAPFRYKSKIMEYGKASKQAKGEKFREEHNPPASVIGANLIWAIANNKVSKIMPSIKNNYYQTQLSKKDDEKIDNAKLDATLPKGKNILDNSAIRLSAAGIDLNTLVNPLTNKTLAQELNVESPSTPDAVEAGNNVVLEDKFEFAIDRAIAKLTELIGTKGFAIDPFLLLAAKDVSLNVLVGGLRTVKATYKAGKNLAKAIDAGYQNVKKYMSEAEWLEFARVATQEVEDVRTPGQVRLSIFNEAGVAQAQEAVRKESEKLLNDLGIETDGLSTSEINAKLDTLRKARNVALDKKAPKKKARVFDFDDTLAQSKSNVLYTLPDGTSGTLSATEFAARSEELMEAGAEFDFSEFSQVKEGKKGPLAVLAKKLTEAKGDRDVFVLTARPANAAEAIQSFLRSALGISIPIENITGLGDGKPSAKAFWMAEKVSEGYNDLFFADDAPKNVAAVDKMLTDLGVKKKVQVAKEAEAPSLEDNMDSILRSKKPTKGFFFRKYNVYVPPGADDFAGLLYTFLGKGKEGETQMKFFQDNIMTPFAKGIAAYEAAKVTLARDHRALKKRYKNKKLLKESILDGLYTNEQAVRAYLYDRAGYDLALNKADSAGLIATVESNPELKAFAEDLAKITKIPAGYPEITPDWLGGNIQTDLANASNKSNRKEFLTEFINNKEQVFSDQNMQLIKQMHGNNFTDALKNVLERMETGVNRKKGKDKEFNAAMNWINQSVANVMAVNLRSAVLQQLSIVNFMNWTHNNPFMMAKAMANVPQFSSDFIELWNSTFLTERRGGLKIEINTADLADSEPGNFFLRTQKKLLELGFKPTQWGDSFAISFGGASWYRNKINQLIKQGMNEAEAKEQAMLELQEIAETSQQSSRPDKISRQQSSEIGRFILAFANTPLQYARETKKAVLDLVNGRGDWKTNASKIVYYGAAQNIIFSGIQSALFSLLLSDEDDDEKEEKKLGYFANNITDGFLRGMGYAGAVIATLKNLGMEYYEQRQKRERGERVYDPALGLIQAGLTISPPVSKKIGDIVEAQKFENWRQYKDDPFYQAFAMANYISALGNIPLDRAFKKAENLMAISADYNAAWQNVLLALGWSPYQLGIDMKNREKTSIFDSSNKKENWFDTPLDKKEALPQGVLGKAHKDGTIQLAPGLSKEKKKEVLAHEKKHIADMKSGKLNYDAQNVYWNGNAYPRTPDKKIIYDGVAYDEGHRHLPWEKSANNIKV